MVVHLLGTEDLSRDLEDLILEKTEGVPFFVEELVKSLNDLGVIENRDNKFVLTQDADLPIIPSTIQDLIMARVDSLPEGPKEVLQAGSVIEREFGYKLIKLVTGLPEQELLTLLSILKDSELLYERGVYPECTYVFKHALTREVVYDSILTNSKKKLHEKIGNALENLCKENIEEHYGVLAEHYVIGENWEKGAEYAKLAGKVAAKKASLNAAIAYAEKRVTCLERLPKTGELQKEIIDARTALGLYMATLQYIGSAKEAIAPIIDSASKSASKKRLSQIFAIMGTYEYQVEEDYARAFYYLEKALEIAEEARDVVSWAFAAYYFGLALSLHCEPERASRYFDKATNIYMAVSSLWGVSVMQSLMSWAVYYWQGEADLAYQTGREAIRVAEESGDMHSKSAAYVAHGIACYGKGFQTEASNNLLIGIDFSDTTNLFVWNELGQHFMGEICFESGDYESAESHFGKSIRVEKDSGWNPSWANMHKMALIRSRSIKSTEHIDMQSTYTYVAANKPKVYEGWIRRYLGEILLNIDDHHISEAQHWIEEAIEADERNGMRFHLGRDIALYAELFKRKGDTFKAKEQLGKAIEIYKECGADGWVTNAEEELGTLQ
jgi:tetratricopeptide (TPR) repeat protein